MSKPKSAVEGVYRQLREDLVSCRIRPGERLLTGPLRTRFEVSFTVVREALVRLAAEGFAVADPQRGFSAAPISIEDLLALTEARIGVEALCLEESIQRGDKAWEALVAQRRDEVLSVPVATSKAPDRVSSRFLEAHEAFHDSLVASCANPWLLRVRASLCVQSSRYLQICIPLGPALPDRERGYRDIADATIARDLDRAVALIADSFKRHTKDFTDALASSLGETQFLCDLEDSSEVYSGPAAQRLEAPAD